MDIYGFENLTVNGFEQLIINYCNEKLQHFTSEMVIKEEQEEYMQEGLEWNPILFADNFALCDLIEKVTNKEFWKKMISIGNSLRFQNNLGLLSILDEESQRPSNGSEETFLNKVAQVFQDSVQIEVARGLPSKSGDSTTMDAFR